MTIEAVAICDSIGQYSSRLLTIRATNPKFVHQETLRHRLIYIEDMLRGDFDFSFSVSSARAIPFAKLCEEAENPETMAKPVKWGAEQRGMSMGDELEDSARKQAEQIWVEAANAAVLHAKRMADIGAHKSIVNRIIEPYIHVHCLMTATEPGWMNFFGLRLDGAADPTVRALAEACWKVWNESMPKRLQPGMWHLPYIEDEDFKTLTKIRGGEASLTIWELACRVSAARCARLSYMSFDTGKISTFKENMALYDRLITSRPIHASPTEHQACIDRIRHEYQNYDSGYHGNPEIWENGRQGGNLGPGWRQFRKMIPGEALAALPEGYCV
jgi:thymidylate synthase ThyX